MFISIAYLLLLSMKRKAFHFSPAGFSLFPYSKFISFQPILSKSYILNKDYERNMYLNSRKHAKPEWASAIVLYGGKRTLV